MKWSKCTRGVWIWKTVLILSSKSVQTILTDCSASTTLDRNQSTGEYLLSTLDLKIEKHRWIFLF